MEVLHQIGGVILAGVLTAIFAVLWYFKRHIDRWKELGVQKHWNLGDCVHGVMKTNKKGVWDLDQMFYNLYGTIYGGFHLFTPILYIADPDILRNIMVKDFASFPSRRRFTSGNKIMNSMMTGLIGEDWKRVRSIVSPAFSSGKIRKMAVLVEESATILCDSIIEVMNKQNFVDFKNYASTYTTDVLFTCAYGTKINSFKDPNNPFVTHARKFFSNDMSFRTFLFLTFPNICKKLNIGMNPGPTQFFLKVTDELIKKRESQKEKTVDFLQLLLNAEHQNIENEENLSHFDLGSEDSQNYIGNPKTKKMSIEEVIAQCLLFFIAGVDTTATTISFLAYELALNPEIQTKLQEEIDEAFKNNEIVDFDVVNQMQYLDCVLSETLRKYPPGTRNERLCAEDYKIESHGITIPKGTIVNIPVYSMHRDPKWFPDPEQFDPERFSQENKAKRHPYCYLPFGAGPRNCVGMRLALLEAKMAIVHLSRKVEFYKVAQTKVPLDYFYGSVVLIARDVTLGVRKRK